LPFSVKEIERFGAFLNSFLADVGCAARCAVGIARCTADSRSRRSSWPGAFFLHFFRRGENGTGLAAESALIQRSLTACCRFQRGSALASPAEGGLSISDARFCAAFRRGYRGLHVPFFRSNTALPSFFLAAGVGRPREG
jgi:hypothetical protein